MRLIWNEIGYRVANVWRWLPLMGARGRFWSDQMVRRAGCKVILMMLLASAGCVLVPGETRVPADRRSVSRHHHYPLAREPHIEGSHVLGIAKLHPAWWAQNSDDPLPWWWRPDEPIEQRKRTWFIRNPMHNFSGYVVGVGDRHRHIVGIQADSIWNEQGQWNATITRSGPLIYLPLISHRGKWVEWYVGWRTSGSLGAALRRAQHDSDGTGNRDRSPLARAMAAQRKREEEEAAVRRATVDVTGASVDRSGLTDHATDQETGQLFRLEDLPAAR